MPQEIERIRTFVEGLDQRMEGGIPSRTVNLICGTPGSMKSSLTYSILFNNARESNLKGLYISLEQDLKSLLGQMKKLGMDHAVGKRNLIGVDYEELSKGARADEGNWLEMMKKYVAAQRKSEGVELVAIDSLDALYSLATIKEPRKEIFHFFKGLRDTGVTSFLISEMPKEGNSYGHYGVEDFLSDGIIHIEFQKKGDILSALERYLGIVKMRSTDHETQYFPMLHIKGGFTIFGREDLELE